VTTVLVLLTNFFRLNLNPNIFFRFLLSLDVRVRPVILFLKQWTADSGFKLNLTSFSVCLLVWVYFAQMENPVLPTLMNLRMKKQETKIVNGM